MIENIKKALRDLIGVMPGPPGPQGAPGLCGLPGPPGMHGMMGPMGANGSNQVNEGLLKHAYEMQKLNEEMKEKVAFLTALVGCSQEHETTRGMWTDLLMTLTLTAPDWLDTADRLTLLDQKQLNEILKMKDVK